MPSLWINSKLLCWWDFKMFRLKIHYPSWVIGGYVSYSTFSLIAKTILIYFLVRNINKLLALIRQSGLTQMMLSSGFRGERTFSENVYCDTYSQYCRDTLIVTIGNCVTSVIAGFPIFSILGFMAKQIGKEVPDVVESGKR